ncbi:MAG: DUF2135 domain-containing protein [Alphaproteobacteria bacterium]|nr:DUF2135 domain-containing protein [Alphaproteobacteria bacterium]
MTSFATSKDFNYRRGTDRRTASGAAMSLFRIMKSSLGALTAVAALALSAADAPAQVSLTTTDPKAAPVTVQSVDISTEVMGRVAVTTFDMVFANPNGRVLEGTFEFPLLDGQRVVRFALDINGKLREAVPVEKEKGRVVFEEIERRRVDPGLLEKTAGNNYRARIFPIPANGTRHVVIAYQEDLGATSAATSAPHYRLALDFLTELKLFSLTAKVLSAGGTTAPKATTTLALDLPAWRDAKILQIRKENFTARGLLEIDLPAMPAVGKAQPAVITETVNGREYFYAEAALPPMKAKPRPVPKAIGILWDASGSGRERDHNREFALLDAWFATVRNVDVKLLLIRNTAAMPVALTVRDGNWADVRAALEKTVYDGATSFDGLADDASVDEWLLFSDALVNFGSTQAIDKLPLRAPLHAVNASTRAAPEFLRGLAARGGGEYADLLAMDAQAAAARLRQVSLRVLGIERNPEAVAQVFPEPGAAVRAESGTLVVTGILRQASATVAVKLGFSEADAQRIEFSVKSGDGASTLAARAWALAKIEHLSAAGGDNRADIRATAQEFRIVTADSSLIVLESLEDHIRYDIAPPAELREQWARYRGSRDTTFGKNRGQHIERVVKLFEERAAWWAKKFPKDQPSKAELRKPIAGIAGTESEDSGRASRTRSRPMAEAEMAVEAEEAPPPARAARERGRGRIHGIVASPPIPMVPMVSLAPLAQVPAASAPPAADRNFDALNGNVNESAGAQQRASNGYTWRSRADVNSTTVPVGDAVHAPIAAASIALQRWSPAAGYLDHIRRVPESERFAAYLEERADHAREPGFYLDVAGYFFDEARDSSTGLQILSNLAELGLEDAPLLRVLGHRLVQAGRPELALPVFERVLKIRGEEPQSRRDLALVADKFGQHQRAVDLLWEVASRPWDDRFPEIELIALGELNAIVAVNRKGLDLSKIDPRLIKDMPVGLRVILTWDANDCDIDLWVDDPNGERAMYSHPRTAQGGRMSEDFIAGYGPEEFLLREPKPGRYTVRINYFGDARQTALGPVTAQLRLITGFGTADEREERLTVRLVDNKDTLEIGSIEIGK